MEKSVVSVNINRGIPILLYGGRFEKSVRLNGCSLIHKN